jgi:hypothetical protein
MQSSRWLPANQTRLGQDPEVATWTLLSLQLLRSTGSEKLVNRVENSRQNVYPAGRTLAGVRGNRLTCKQETRR